MLFCNTILLLICYKVLLLLPFTGWLMTCYPSTPGVLLTLLCRSLILNEKSLFERNFFLGRPNLYTHKEHSPLSPTQPILQISMNHAYLVYYTECPTLGRIVSLPLSVLVSPAKSKMHCFRKQIQFIYLFTYLHPIYFIRNA